MRILVTSTPGLGHVLPLRPLAVELQARGHQVRWVAGQGSSDVLPDAGFDVTVAGLPVRDRLDEFFRRYPDTWSLPEEERRAVAFSKLFGELAAPPVLEVLRPLVEDWRPDLVLHDAAELAAPIVAASIGVPSVCQGFGEIMPEPSARRAGEQMAPLWRDSGLDPDEYAGSYRGLYVDIYPPSLRLAGHVPRGGNAALPPGGGCRGIRRARVRHLRHRLERRGRRLPRRGGGRGERRGRGARHRRPAGNPSSLGAVPTNVVVERFVPQAEVLPRSAAVVCHGGSGTVLASLAHGVPLLCLPRGADQFANAANLERVGAGSHAVGVERCRRRGR